MKDVKLFIAVPSTQTWEADFGMDLVFLMNYLTSHAEVDKGEVVGFRLHNKRGSILANMREWLVQEAIEGGATHLLFIDSDQTFPRDLFHRLYNRHKNVVAVNVTTKMLPPSTTARQKGGDAGIPVYTGEHDTELLKVWRVGTGIMLLDLNLFKREGMEGPWFNQRWNKENNAYVGEDWAFCEKLEQSGINIYVDQDVSREIGHIGKLTYGHDMVAPNLGELKNGTA